tara:strand:- start:1136 stop:1576 length:441 start_codon:yes stop_codon:yes gene_type:complete
MTYYIRAIFHADGSTWTTKCVLDVTNVHYICSAEKMALLVPVNDEEECFYVKAGERHGSLLAPPVGVYTIGLPFGVRGNVNAACKRGAQAKGWKAKPSTLRYVCCERCSGMGTKYRYPGVARRMVAYNCPACGGGGEVYRYVEDAE